MKDAGFGAGLRQGIPLALGALPFGMAVGVLAVDGGFSVLGALGMSVAIFAGSAQLAVLQLAKNGAPAVVILAVAIGINLRFSMYGAALAPLLRTVAVLPRIGLSYLLTDQAFAVTHARMRDPEPPARPVAFYFGVALALWLAWQVGTVVGASAGARLPEALPVDFAAPLVFVALSALSIRDRADAWAAAVAGLAVLALQGLPFGLGLLPAAAAGIAAGRWGQARG